MPSSRITAELRRRVFESARFRCGYCQTSQFVIGPLDVWDEHFEWREVGAIIYESRNWVRNCPCA